MKRTYTIHYNTADEINKVFTIEADFEQDARDAFYYEVETEEPEVEIICIENEGEKAMTTYYIVDNQGNTYGTSTSKKEIELMLSDLDFTEEDIAEREIEIINDSEEE